MTHPEAPPRAGFWRRLGLALGRVELGRLRLGAAAASLRLLFPALLPVLLPLPFILAPPLNHDVAAVLSFSERWLAGERLYVDLVDVNPPLIFVLNLVPAALEEVAGIDGPLALQLCVVALGLLAWWLALRLRDRPSEGPVLRALLDALPGLFLFGAGYDFGQREHLMAIVALPYVLNAAARDGPRRPRARLAAALLAGIGFALKPHFLAIPALIELAVLMSRRERSGWLAAIRATLRDPVPWIMVLVWAGYLAALPLLFPQYLRFVVPLVWAFYLNEGDTTALGVLFLPRMLTVICLLLPLLWLAFRRPGALPRLLGLSAVGALAAAVAQHKGWSYHIVPIEFFAITLGLVLVALWLDQRRLVDGRRQAARFAGGLGALWLLYAMSNGEAPWKELGYADSDVAGLTALLRQDAEGERVLVLSPGISPVFPALNYAHARLTLHTMNMWLLEGAYGECLPDNRRYREVWEMSRPEFYVYRSVAEDFARAPPAAVVVDTQPGIPWCGEEFDFIAYFSRHQLFAEVWSHYEQTAQWGHYKLFTRKD